LKRAASTRSPKSWIVGRGWDQEKLQEKRYPTKKDLDSIPNPVFIRRICGHIGTANSRALSIVGISQNTQDPNGGVIERESSSNEPNGVLKERALDLVTSSIPRTDNELRELLPIACQNLLKIGLTSLHCIIEDGKELAIINAMMKKGKIPQSIFPILPMKYFIKNLSQERNSTLHKSVKIYLDGSLGGRTAFLAKPYHDDPGNVGILTTSKEELVKIAKLAKRSGSQMCIHAIGDRAVDIALGTLRKVFGPKLCKKLRHRIEHSSLTSSSLIAKMSRLGVIASVQPRFILSDAWAVERLGVRRAKQLYMFRAMQRNHIPITSGSDCPVEDPSPWEGIWSAVSRPDGNSAQGLTVEKALNTYTECASYASFSESSSGTLEPGKNADMVILDRDPFVCEVDDLRHVKVVNTVVGGDVLA
jgi:predicted amidohydrolase YtcJ